MQKILIITGIVILLVGFIWPLLTKLQIGSMPGDIKIDKPNLKVYIPVTSMVLISIILSLILWLFRKK